MPSFLVSTFDMFLPSQTDRTTCLLFPVYIAEVSIDYQLEFLRDITYGMTTET